MIKRLLLFVVISYGLFWWFVSKNITVTSNEEKYTFDYIVKNYEKDSKLGAPMLIALHGNGDTAENFYESFLKGIKAKRLRIILIKGSESFSGGKIKAKAWPMDAERLKKVGDALALAIKKLTKKHQTRSKPALVGFSGGGGMAYYLAANHPNLFSYIIPISGKLPPSFFNKKKNRKKSQVKIYPFHGTKDRVIDYRLGKKSSNLLRKSGLDVEFHRFVGGHLDIFTKQKKRIIELLEEIAEAL